MESAECERSCDVSFQFSRFSASCFTDPLMVTYVQITQMSVLILL